MKNVQEKPVQEKENVGSIVLLNIVLTNEQLIEELQNKSSEDRAKIFAKFQKKEEKNTREKKEQYESLKPTGFENAPKSAKEKWEEYKNTDNVEKLQWIHDNVSYNTDQTMNILKLKKTFCEDVSGTGQRCNWEDAIALAKSKGYTLGTDYNDCDSDKIKKKSDWYKVINIFSNGHGDTTEGMELFIDMSGCNNRYWTATLYKDENGIENKGAALDRELSKNDGDRNFYNTSNYNRVCGFKPAP